LARKI